VVKQGWFKTTLRLNASNKSSFAILAFVLQTAEFTKIYWQRRMKSPLRSSNNGLKPHLGIVIRAAHAVDGGTRKVLFLSGGRMQVGAVNILRIGDPSVLGVILNQMHGWRWPFVTCNNRNNVMYAE
jgi:hypothetical protein